ncbi:MAG: peptide-binding protein [Verrucomicrobia bacterium]|nr:peptide-binding protein [Verrucomicrobiota bacterium]
MKRLFSAVFVSLLIQAPPLFSADFHVSPAGKDGNPGTSGQPFQTLHAAQKAVRKVAGHEPVNVIVRGGVYYLPEALVFTPEDSGSKTAPVVWQAAKGEMPIISGGQALKLEWQAWKAGIFQAKVPAGLDTDQLFVNGERQILARYPNFNPKERIFNGYAPDAISSGRAKNWSDPAGGFFHAMHPAQWGGFSYLITGKDEKGNVTYEGGWQGNRAHSPHGKMRMVEGIFEELDAPGEWFLDKKTSTLYFYPPAGVDLKTATVESVRLVHLVEFRGSEQKPVKFIQLNGFTFRHTLRTFMLTKEPLLRSDWTIYRGGAVVFDGAEDCALENSQLDQVGGNAVFVNNYNRRVAVRGCIIGKSGAGGVMVVGDPKAVRSPLFEYAQKQSFDTVDLTPGPKTNNYPADCLVEDCIITLVGRVDKQSTGVGVDMAARITVRHCSIYDMPRAGINIGDGCWGGHVIEFCDIFDTVKETGDHGSYNSWGRDRYWNLQGWNPKTHAEVAYLDVVEPIVLRNNRWRCDHGWDVDLDDGSSNYEIYNNLLLNGGLKLREGYRRRVWNNIAINNTLHPHVWYEDSSDEVTKNIWMGAYRPAGRMPGKWGKEVDRNFFTTSEADRTKFGGRGCDLNSVSGDPQFMDPAKGDFRVKDGSPALQVGFVNFPMDQFGVVSPALKAKVRTPEIPQITGVRLTEGSAFPKRRK